MSEINECINLAIKRIGEEKSIDFVFKELINGYRDMNPFRGTTYILDLLLINKNTQEELFKRFTLMRPLGEFEIKRININLKRGTKINLIICFSRENTKVDIDNFINSFNNNVGNLFSKYFKYIYICFFNNNQNEQKNEIFVHLKKKIDELTNSFNYEIKEIVLDEFYFSFDYRQLISIDSFKDKISDNDIILTVPSCAIISIDFLNRVMLNTIKNQQVFFPIAFHGYNYSLIRGNVITQLKFDNFHGYLNQYSYEYASFYKSDFNNIISNKNNYNLFELFNKTTNLNIFRAVDKTLCRWKPIDCNHKMYSDQEEIRCYKQRVFGTGTKLSLYHLFNF